VPQAVVTTWDGGGLLCPLAVDGTPTGPVRRVDDLAAAVAAEPDGVRWVWPFTEEIYPALLRAGVRVTRCHDLTLTEALLTGYDGHWGAPHGLAAAWARLNGRPVPDDPPPRTRDRQPALFEPDRTGLGEEGALTAAVAVYADQLRRLATITDHPLGLLAAAESAGALAAAEMGHTGLPWRADVHDALLTDLLGERPPPGTPPPKLAALADRIGAAFGGRKVNVDSPADLRRAFTEVGITVPNTRSWVLKEIDHPAVPLVLEYKELARLHVAHGWSWLDAWVHGGRFRAEYVAGGVVSGRWATRGGGALQIPKAVRRAVVADPGWVLVAADAAQLEPRVLAALADDRRLGELAAETDLYTALALDAFAGDRARAKVGLLGVLYGQTSGLAGELLAVLRRRFPAAIGYVEAAARAGEQGRLVRSRWGRTCPPPSERWWELSQRANDTGGDRAVQEAAERSAGQAARDRGRFTRNFVVQATAADWALALLATVRLTLPPPADLVFFQHDELVVHCPAELAGEVSAVLEAAAEEARHLVFGDTPVRFPLEVAVVDCYADAK
jgi:DNA polymerase I